MGSIAHREIACLFAKLRRNWSIAVNKQLSVLGFSLHEYAILRCLSEHEEVSQSQLAHDAALDTAAVSRLVRQLRQARMMTTRVDPNDKRQRLAKLTSKGQTLLRTLSPVVDGGLKPYLRGLTSAEEEELLRLLRKAEECAVQAAGEGDDGSEPAAEARSNSPAAPRTRPRRDARAQPDRSRAAAARMPERGATSGLSARA